MLNESTIDRALFNIEEELRILSAVASGRCFVVAVYDMCRIDASKYKVDSDKQKEQQAKDRKEAFMRKIAAAQEGRGGDYVFLKE